MYRIYLVIILPVRRQIYQAAWIPNPLTLNRSIANINLLGLNIAYTYYIAKTDVIDPC
jgi:hypothetical protein